MSTSEPSNEFSRPIPVLLVEDQGMFRAFLEQWLLGQPRFRLAGSAPSGEKALELVASLSPEILLVDLQLPAMDGLEFVSAARQLRPQARALILSSLIDPLALTRVRESGVEGYLEKDAPLSELAAALESIASGARYFSARFRETMASESTNGQALGKILSRREQEILTHVLAGETSRQTALLIGLSPRTVEFHRSNIMAKLGVSNVVELAARVNQSSS